MSFLHKCADYGIFANVCDLGPKPWTRAQLSFLGRIHVLVHGYVPVRPFLPLRRQKKSFEHVCMYVYITMRYATMNR